MILERFILKIFAPVKLAHRDIAGIHRALSTSYSRCQQGYWISLHTGIPERDLDFALALMESEQYIERDPGPFDQPYTTDRMKAWWAPGREWPALKKRVRELT